MEKLSSKNQNIYFSDNGKVGNCFHVDARHWITASNCTILTGASNFNIVYLFKSSIIQKKPNRCYQLFTSILKSVMNYESAMSKSIYFAYGSNLLSKRIHHMNPNAVRWGKGILKNYALDFGNYSTFWKGCAATIIEKPGHEVWGALWELNDVDFENLDKQEGVHLNIYRPVIVDIETPDGKIIKCKSYQQVNKYEEIDLTKLPEDRRPSPAYLNVIVQGAEETGLPNEYINFLKTVVTNSTTYIPNFDST